MSVLVGDLLVKLALENASYKAELEKSRQQSEQSTTIMQQGADLVGKAWQVAGPVIIGALAAVGTATVAAIGMGSDLNETMNQTGVIFGEAGANVVAFSETTASTLGQSQQAALGASNTFGALGKSAGLAGEDLSDFSIDLTTLASDLASFKNTTPEEAVYALGAALRGESEPIRKYDVLLNEATIKQKALEMGIISTTTNALTPQQKVLATYQVIMEATADAQGDFANTSEGLANTQRTLTAEVTDLATQWGTALLPIVEEFAGEAVPVLIEGLQVLTEAHLPAFVELVGQAADVLLEAFKAGMLLVTWNEQIQMTYAEQAEQLALSNMSYEEYAQNLLAAAVAAGYINESWVNMHGAALIAGEGFEGVALTIGLLSEQERINRQEINALTDIYEAAGVSAYVWGSALETAAEKAGGASAYLESTLVSARAEQEAMNEVMGDFSYATYEAEQAMQAEADAIREAQEAAQAFNLDKLRSELDQDVSNPLEELISSIDFMIASGGQNFARAMGEVEQAVADGKITPEQGKEFFAALLVGIDEAKIAAGQMDLSEAKQHVMETLGITAAEADALFAEVTTVTDTLADLHSTITVNAQELEEAHEIAQQLGNETIYIMADGSEASQELEDFKSEFDDVAAQAEVFYPVQQGLDQVAQNAEAARQAILRMQAAINQVDTSNLAPFIAESPAPLALGLGQVSELLPTVTLMIGALSAEADSFVTDFMAGFQEGLEATADQVERLDAILGAANEFGNIGGGFADIFSAQTLDPLKDQLADIEQQMEDLSTADNVDYYALVALNVQRAEIAKQIAEEEQRILDLQQQQQELDFLKTQLDLLEMAKSAGVDLSAFEGKLGSGADPAALLDLTNNVINKLLEQANAELGGTAPASNQSFFAAGAGGGGFSMADGTMSMGKPGIYIENLNLTAENVDDFLEQLYALQQQG